MIVSIATALKNVEFVSSEGFTATARYADGSRAGAVIYNGDPLKWQPYWDLEKHIWKAERLMIFAMRRGRLGPKGRLP